MTSEPARPNPYASPEGPSEARISQEDVLSPTDQRCLCVGRVVVAWEKLRIVYNVVLAVEAAAFLVGVFPVGRTGRGLVKQIVLGGLAANLFFCAGPVIDGYLSWLGLRSRWITSILFLLGTALAMLMGAAYLGPFAAIDD